MRINTKKEEIGNIYGHLTVIAEAGRSNGRQILWSCRCSCGNKIIVPGGDLRTGHTKSCGCYKREITRKRMSEHMKSAKGEKNPNWRGGIITKTIIRWSPEYKEWRTTVFKRDNFTCQNCGYKGKKLNAHHLVIPFKDCFDDKEMLLNIDNGLTLCEKCHKKLHKTKGK